MAPAVQMVCLDALIESVREVGATVLGGLSFEVVAPREIPAGHGAYVGLVAQDEPIQVGILVEGGGCQALAKTLLGMSSSDEDLPPADVSDAMCEIINIVAGGLKRRVHEQMPVVMGLPLFVSGQPLPNQQQSLSARSVQLGGVAARVLLLTQKPDAEAVSRRGVAIQASGQKSANERLA